VKKHLLFIVLFILSFTGLNSVLLGSDLSLLTSSLSVACLAYQAVPSDEKILKSVQSQLAPFSRYRRCSDADTTPLGEIEKTLENNLNYLGLLTTQIDENCLESMCEDSINLERYFVHAGRNVWLRSWFSQDMEELLGDMKTCIAEVQKVRNLFLRHRHYLKGCSLLNFYDQMPDRVVPLSVKHSFISPSKKSSDVDLDSESKKLEKWVYSKVRSLVDKKIIEDQKFPLSFYIKKVGQDIDFLEESEIFDSSLYPNLITAITLRKSAMEGSVCDIKKTDKFNLELTAQRKLGLSRTL
jgi:hypothetical protein